MGGGYYIHLKKERKKKSLIILWTVFIDGIESVTESIEWQLINIYIYLQTFKKKKKKKEEIYLDFVMRYTLGPMVWLLSILEVRSWQDGPKSWLGPTIYTFLTS